MLKQGVMLAPSFPAKVVAKRAKMVEDAGIEYVWIGEEFNRELYTTLTTVALATESVKLGLGGTNPYTRSLAVTGIALLTLDEISNGRVVVGMGSGGPAILHKACITPKTPFSAVRDSITVLRRLFAGEAVTMKGHEVAVRSLQVQYHNDAIPIYIAGKGPRMMRLAGEVCQGVYMSGPLNYLKTAMKNVKKGATKAGQDVSEF